MDIKKRYKVSEKIPDIVKEESDRMYDQCSEYILELGTLYSGPVIVYPYGDESGSFEAVYYLRYANESVERTAWMSDTDFYDVSSDDEWEYK